MAVKKLSVALDEKVARAAATAARRQGLSLSGWLNAAAARELAVEQGLAAVREWETIHGELEEQELSWADSVLDGDRPGDRDGDIDRAAT